MSLGSPKFELNITFLLLSAMLLSRRTHRVRVSSVVYLLPRHISGLYKAFYKKN